MAQKEKIAAVETIVSTEQKDEAAELMELVQALEPSEQQTLATFIQGARFAKTLNKKESA